MIFGLTQAIAHHHTICWSFILNAKVCQIPQRFAYKQEEIWRRIYGYIEDILVRLRSLFFRWILLCGWRHRSTSYFRFGVKRLFLHSRMLWNILLILMIHVLCGYNWSNYWWLCIGNDVQKAFRGFLGWSLRRHTLLV